MPHRHPLSRTPLRERYHEPRSGPAAGGPSTGRRRFLGWDEYRVEREWRRYEGTPLRDLYRQLRERFLDRHRPVEPGRSLDVGAGPGRFTELVGHSADRYAVLDLSQAMLTRFRAVTVATSLSGADLVRGDAVKPPFRPRNFHRVALLGNVVGFAESDAPTLLERAAELVSAHGLLLTECSAGSGERSTYLHRLPPGAVARLLAAPVRAVLPRVAREGFGPVRGRSPEGSHFRRIAVSEIADLLRSSGFEIRETMAVAPCLGNDAGRLSVVRSNPTAWEHLLELEETIGHDPPRWVKAAAILVAAERVSV